MIGVAIYKEAEGPGTPEGADSTHKPSAPARLCRPSAPPRAPTPCRRQSLETRDRSSEKNGCCARARQLPVHKSPPDRTRIVRARERARHRVSPAGNPSNAAAAAAAAANPRASQHTKERRTVLARHALVRLTVLAESAVLRRLVRRLGVLGVLGHLVRRLRHRVVRLHHTERTHARHRIAPQRMSEKKRVRKSARVQSSRSFNGLVGNAYHSFSL